MIALRIEAISDSDSGLCDCCGGRSRTVWGYAHRGDETVAVYFVQWTLGNVHRHGAHVDVIIGKWGDGAGPADRYGVAVEFRRTEHGAGFMVIDSAGRPAATKDLTDRPMARGEVIGTALGHLVFEILDAIWQQDDRIAEVVRVGQEDPG